jgi:hypothetical protein
VRQQWNFSPPKTIREVEDYQVALLDVTVLELVIVPDKSRGAARASLRSLRLSYSPHLDFQRFRFPDSWYTNGFYERTAALYHQARWTPQKRLFWVPTSGGRWRIDWPRTNRGA